MRRNREHPGELEDELRSWLSGAEKVAVAGVGNTIRCDDGAGVKVAEGLRGLVSERVHLIECETVPESFVDEIIELRPSHVLIVDAALLGLRPGEAVLYEAEEVLDVPSISTHTLPMRVFCEYVRELTGARIALVLVEPEEFGFGEGLSAVVRRSVDRVVAALIDSLP